jgi:hypothetical protein
MRVIEQLRQENPTPKPARSPLVGGTWRLVWSQQAADASPLQKWGSAQARCARVCACVVWRGVACRVAVRLR